MGHSVFELKAELVKRGVDFSHCTEKSELERLLKDAESEASCSAETVDQSLSAGVYPCDRASCGSSSCVTEPVSTDTAAVDQIFGMSARDLKSQLQFRGIDFSHCVEKGELRALLRTALEEERSRPTVATSSTEQVAESDDEDVAEAFFASCRQDGHVCWVEFVSDGDALCYWDDGTDSITPAAELDVLEDGQVPGPQSFSGTFEAARAEAFLSGRILVAAISGSAGKSKSHQLHTLVLASDEISGLFEENAIFWRGSASEVRAPHLQQLAPVGTPSLAMVLPLAVDAMRVLSHSTGSNKETVVEAFVAALEAFEQHQEAAQARAFSAEAQLRWEQEEEFAASLAADQQRSEERRQASKEVERNSADMAQKHEEAVDDASAGTANQPKRPAVDSDEEKLAKIRRNMSHEFLETPTQLEGVPVSKLVLRLPTGERIERTFRAADQLNTVYRWAACCYLLPEAKGRSLTIPAKFHLSMAYPPRKFGEDVADKTLSEVGLCPNAALLLIERSDTDANL